ncbi:sulfatase [bacterium]|nr:sulfatase [bacterium]
MKKRPNVILITIDSLRADHLGFMGYKKNVSPNIDKLAKESIIFTNAYANGPQTPYSFPSILTSTYPLDYHGPSKIAPPRIMISEVLKEAGYTTCAIHFFPCLSSYFGYNRGWDYFEDIDPTKFSDYSIFQSFLFKKLYDTFKGISFSYCPELLFRIKFLIQKIGSIPLNVNKPDSTFLNQIAEDFINSVNSPFFLWIHYPDIHAPYRTLKVRTGQNLSFSYLEFLHQNLFNHSKYFYQKRKLREFAKKNLSGVIDVYDQGIIFLDQQISNLINFLKEKRKYENSTIILTADHGDEFLEHGGGGHFAKLYNEILHVPLLIKTPYYKKTLITRKVSLIDLAPTICRILDIKTPPNFKGKDLLINKNSEQPIFHQTLYRKIKGKPSFLWEDYFQPGRIEQSRVACQFQNWKYILDHGSGKEELYNLLNDPKEQHDLSHLRSETLSQMREIVKEFENKNPPLSLVTH